MLQENGTAMFDVDEYWDPGYPARPRRETHACVLGALTAQGTAIKRPLQDASVGGNPVVVSTQSRTVVPIGLPNSNLPADRFNLAIIHSDKAPTTKREKCTVPHVLGCPEAYRMNNASIVIRLVLDGHSFLLTGDVNGRRGTGEPLGEVEKLLVGLGPAIASDVVRIPHHGHRSSSHPEFVCTVGARYAVASEHNYFGVGLPRTNILRRYEDGPENCPGAKQATVFNQRIGENRHVKCAPDPEGRLQCGYQTRLELPEDGR